MNAQLPPTGRHPTVGVLLIGALLWSEPADAAAVLELVTDEDMATPSLSLVLSAVRRLVSAGTPPGPQLVLDALRREGTLKNFALKASSPLPVRCSPRSTSPSIPTGCRW